MKKRNNGWHGLVGLIFSPGAGLIFFFPVAILLPLAFKYMYRRNKGLFFLSAYIIIATWVGYF
jgi:glycopeptide antibiotics resistance protein